jgi:C4-dicarboxylate transporter, DctQ subunit
MMVGLALLITLYEIVTRYAAPRYALDWALEVVIYLLVGAIFFAGSGLVARGRHVRADVLMRLVESGAQRWFEAAACLVGALFCAAMTFYGIAVVRFAHMVGEVSDSSLLFPRWIFYLVLPIGFGLMTVRYALRLWSYLFRFDPTTLTRGREPAHLD